MAAVELLRGAKVFEVLVVGPDLDGVSSSFEVVAPFFEPSNDREHLRVVDFVVSLDRPERFRQEGDRVPLAVLARLLRKDRAVANPELLALRRKGLSLSGSARTGAEVTSPLSFAKVSSWGGPQLNLTSFTVRSKSAQAWCENLGMNRR